MGRAPKSVRARCGAETEVTAMAAALETHALGVRFGGVCAIDGVSFTIAPASVHALVGPNGSGKTTILNAICGFVSAQGEVRLGGLNIERQPPHRRMKFGLGRTFQNPRGARNLTVRELLRIGEHLRGAQPWWRVALTPLRADAELKRSMHRAQELLTLVGLGPDLLDTQLMRLPSGVLKMVDIVRALMGEPRVLLLDEPTSGMNDAEIDVLHSALQTLRGEKLTIVLVEHNLRFMFNICDTATVLDAGEVVAEGAPAEVFARDEVIRTYMGESQAADSLGLGEPQSAIEE